MTLHKVDGLITSLPKKYKPIVNFITMQESDSSLASVRFAQDTAVNWGAKVPFIRSAADFGDVSFMEFSENFLVYFGPKFLGENIFRKIFSKTLSKDLKAKVSIPAQELLKDNAESKENIKRLIPVKAAIALCGLAIPLSEYSLTYLKNIFTLKIFKKADFNNIANLEKNKAEDKAKQEKVKKSAVKHIKMALGAMAGCFSLAALIATKGKNSKILTNISEYILAPGNKLFKHNEKKAATFNKYFSLDFSNNNGKLGLSRGQLTACVVTGFFGYTGAAKDRGKQNLLEVLFRYPLVGFYVVTGSELFEKGLKKILYKKDSYKNILDKDLNVPALAKLPELARKIAAQKGSLEQDEFKKLFKQKSVITLVPFLFGVGVMGLFVAAMSRFFTQYRYNKEKNM